MKSLAGGFWRLSPWLARLILAWTVLGFGQVAWSYLTDPVGSALNSDIALNSVGAVSHIRVVFGGFHLTFALIALFCFLSRERVLTGLLIVAVVTTVAVAIRLTGIAIEGTTPRLFFLLRNEATTMLLSFVGILLHWTGRKHVLLTAPTNEPSHAAKWKR